SAAAGRPPDRPGAGPSLALLAVRRRHRPPPSLHAALAGPRRAGRADPGPARLPRLGGAARLGGEPVAPPAPAPGRAADRAVGRRAGPALPRPRPAARVPAR